MASKWKVNTKREERQTAISLFGGITVWFLHLNTVYGLPSLSCRWGWFAFTVGGLSGLQIVEIALSVIALALFVVMIYLPMLEWRLFQSRAAQRNPNLLHDTEQDRRPFVAFIAMLLNSLFALYVIGWFLPILMLNACSEG